MTWGAGVVGWTVHVIERGLCRTWASYRSLVLRSAYGRHDLGEFLNPFSQVLKVEVPVMSAFSLLMMTFGVVVWFINQRAVLDCFLLL